MPVGKELALSQRLSLPSLFAALALATSAQASRGPFVVRIEYQAPPGCPAKDSFLRQVRERAHHTRFALDGEPAHEFHADVTQTSGRYRARLEFVDPDAHRVSRELEGNSCDEVASALALITALAIDPLLSEPTRPSGIPESPIDTAPVSKSLPVVPVGTTAATHSRETVAASSRNEDEPRRWLPALGASLGAAFDVAPKWAPSFSLLSEFASPSRSAAIRLELSYAVSASSADAASATFRLAAGAVEGCPWSGKVARGVRLWPCAALEAGVFRAEGRASARWPTTNAMSTWWLAGDAVLRAQLELSAQLALELGVKMRAPLLRNTYVYERPLVSVYKTPAIGAAMYLGFTVRLGK